MRGPGPEGPCATDAAEHRPPQRRAVHLLAADGLLTDRYLPRHYFTLCGELLTGADLPHATCEDDDCGCDEVYYCPRCIHEAAGWNAEIDQADQASEVR